MMCLGLLYREGVCRYILKSRVRELKGGATTGQYHIIKTDVKGSPTAQHIYQVGVEISLGTNYEKKEGRTRFMTHQAICGSV